MNLIILYEDYTSKYLHSQNNLQIRNIIHHYLVYLRKIRYVICLITPIWSCDRTLYKILYKYLNLRKKRIFYKYKTCWLISYVGVCIRSNREWDIGSANKRGENYNCGPWGALDSRLDWSLVSSERPETKNDFRLARLD